MSRTVTMRMNTNHATAKALENAVDSLKQLDSAGCNVHAVVIKDGRATLLIETPPGPFAGTVRLHTNSQGKREGLWAAEVAGCRVEWTAPPQMTLVTG